MNLLTEFLARAGTQPGKTAIALANTTIRTAFAIPTVFAVGIAAAALAQLLIPCPATADPPVGIASPASSTPTSSDNDTGGIITVAAGTKVDVALGQDVSQPESDIMFHVAHDIYGPDHDLLIAEGTPAYGRSFKIKSSPGQPAGFDLCCSYILTANGTRLPLRSEHETTHGWTKTTVDFLPEGSQVLANSGLLFTVVVDKDARVNKPLAYQTKEGHDALAPEPAVGEQIDEAAADTLTLPRQKPPQMHVMNPQPALGIPQGLDPANTNSAGWKAWFQQHGIHPGPPD